MAKDEHPAWKVQKRRKGLTTIQSFGSWAQEHGYSDADVAKLRKIGKPDKPKKGK